MTITFGGTPITESDIWKLEVNEKSNGLWQFLVYNKDGEVILRRKYDGSVTRFYVAYLTCAVLVDENREVETVIKGDLYEQHEQEEQEDRERVGRQGDKTLSK